MPPSLEIRDTALKRLKGTFKSSSGILLPKIERHVMRSLRDDPERAVEIMHPSDMCKPDWCGRHDFYRITGATPERKSQANPSFRMTNVFAEGHAIHGKYQQWMWDMGILLGDFRCKECGHRWFDKSPTECQFCKSERLEYKEYPLRHERYMIGGHADAGVQTTGLRALVEIKSIGIRTLAFEAPRLYNMYLDGTKPEDIWMMINHPFGSHMRQAQLYMWMAWPVYEQMVFIYESKFHQQTKEFVVEYNKGLIAPVLAIAKEVSAGVRAGIAPDRPDWATDPVVKVCRSCVYRNKCWGITNAKQEKAATTIRVKRAAPSKRRRGLRSS